MSIIAMLGIQSLAVIARQRRRQHVEQLVRRPRYSLAWLRVRHRTVRRHRPSHRRPNCVLRLPFYPSHRLANVVLVFVTIRMLPKLTCISTSNNLMRNMRTSRRWRRFTHTKLFSSLVRPRLPLKSVRIVSVLSNSSHIIRLDTLLIRNCLPLIYTSTISILRRFELCWSISTRVVSFRPVTRSKRISIRSISFVLPSNTIWTNCVNWPSPRC